VDGLPPGEGAFLPCSFWLADCLHLIGRTADARALFERLLQLRNPLGLLSEEFDPRVGRQVGNFPQAFSHVGLINTAQNLSTAVVGPAEHRSGQSGVPWANAPVVDATSAVPKPPVDDRGLPTARTRPKARHMGQAVKPPPVGKPVRPKRKRTSEDAGGAKKKKRPAVSKTRARPATSRSRKPARR
jgi:hypothetical protein